MDLLWRTLADAVVGIHFAFLAYLVVGGLLAWRWRRSVVVRHFYPADRQGLTQLLVGGVVLASWIGYPAPARQRLSRRRRGA